VSARASKVAAAAPVAPDDDRGHWRATQGGRTWIPNPAYRPPGRPFDRCAALVAEGVLVVDLRGEAEEESE
jgi:hypothetical protein